MPHNPDFNGQRQAGVGYYQLTQRNVRRSSAASACLRPVQHRDNPTVLTGATVLRVTLDQNRATGVRVLQNRQTITYHAAREVLLTTGAIGTPRLLQLSGIGPAEHLASVGIPVAHDLPGVGENLQDHLDLCVLAACTGPHSYDGVQRWDRSAMAGLQYMLFKSGPVAASLFETGGFWYADPAAPYPDTQFHFGQGSGIENGIVKLSGAGITLNSAFLRTRSRGTVRLGSADPFAAPLIDPNYWSDPHDLDMSLRGLAMARDILRQPSLQPWLRAEAVPGDHIISRDDLFAYACRMAKTDHHPVGTCKKGRDAMAVVDHDLRVHGLDGLRVCDASVMPFIPSSNTNAPTIMVGEKAADLIRGLDPLPPARFRDERNDLRKELA